MQAYRESRAAQSNSRCPRHSNADARAGGSCVGRCRTAVRRRPPGLRRSEWEDGSHSKAKGIQVVFVSENPNVVRGGPYAKSVRQ